MFVQSYHLQAAMEIKTNFDFDFNLNIKNFNDFDSDSNSNIGNNFDLIRFSISISIPVYKSHYSPEKEKPFVSSLERSGAEPRREAI